MRQTFHISLRVRYGEVYKINSCLYLGGPMKMILVRGGVGTIVQKS